MKINIFEYIVMRKMIFSSEINKIKKHDVPDLYILLPSPNLFLFRNLFTVPATWQCVDHKNVVVPEALWSSAWRLRESNDF